MSVRLPLGHFLAPVLLGVFSVDALATPFALLSDESQIEFVVKEMGVPVTGKFARFQADIDIDSRNPEKSSASIRIEVGSLTTGNEEADAIAVDTNWLDGSHAPFALFRSMSIRSLGGGRFVARGTLNIRNKERNIELQFVRSDSAPQKMLIDGNLVIHRTEFGIGGGEWNEGGVVAEEIPVKVHLALAPASAKDRVAAVR